jgi:hypothetical protein
MSKWSSGFRDGRFLNLQSAIYSFSNKRCVSCETNCTSNQVRILLLQPGLAPWDHDETNMALFCDKCWDERKIQMRWFAFLSTRLPNYHYSKILKSITKIINEEIGVME